MFRRRWVAVFGVSGILSLSVASASPQEEAPDMMDLYLAQMSGEASSVEIARLTDSDMSCEELFAESRYLEEQIAQAPPPPDFVALSEEMRKSAMKQAAGAQARSVVGGIVGSAISNAVPGAGMITSHLSQANAMGAMAGVNREMEKQMQAIVEAQQQAMGRYAMEGRKQHVTKLFLDHSCRVSQLDAALVAEAHAVLARGESLPQMTQPALSSLSHDHRADGAIPPPSEEWAPIDANPEANANVISELPVNEDRAEELPVDEDSY